jgi:hypothetical protein
MSRKYQLHANARAIVDSVRDQTDDAKAWQRRDHVVAVHQARDVKAWHEQREREQLRRELLAIAAPLLK